MKFRINMQLLNKLSDAVVAAVFFAGFKELGNQSPFKSTRKPEIMRTTGVIWLMPKGVGNKTMAIASMSVAPHFLQFDAYHRKFNQIDAFECLLKLGILESFESSDASDGGVF